MVWGYGIYRTISSRPVRSNPLVVSLLVPKLRRENMAGKNTAVFGIYHDRLAVEEAVNVLTAAGFRSADISVLLQENQGTKDFAHEKNTKAPEGAATGGLVGGITGGVLGLLTGIGTLAIPGLGPLIAAGPIVAALAGMGAVGAAGGILGGLVGMGVPEYEAKRFEGRIKHGGALMSVHCDNDDWVKRAKDILRQTGAEDIGSAGESGADFSVSDRPMLRTRRALSGDLPAVENEPLLDRPEPVLSTRRAASGDLLTENEPLLERTGQIVPEP
jgi:hypothetical protein